MGSNCSKQAIQLCQKCFAFNHTSNLELMPLQVVAQENQNFQNTESNIESISEQPTQSNQLEQNEQQSEELSLIKQKKSQEEHQQFEQFVQTIPTLNSLNTEDINCIGEEGFRILKDRLDYHNDYETVIDEDNIIIWFKSYVTEQKMVISQIKFTFYVNCTLDQYLNFQQDCQKQKELDSKIVEYHRIGGESESSVIHVKYKKHLFFDPRECVYVKYFKKSDDENSIYQVCRSVNFDEQEKGTKFVRADNLISGEQIKVESANKLRINAITEVDMKVKIPAKMTKVITCKELKKFIQKTQNMFTNAE